MLLIIRAFIIFVNIKFGFMFIILVNVSQLILFTLLINKKRLPDIGIVHVLN